MRPNIELHIEELVLHGFAPGDQHGIAEAVQQELIRLFREQGVPPALRQAGEIPRLDGGAFNVQHPSSLRSTGNQVARAVHGGLAK